MPVKAKLKPPKRKFQFSIRQLADKFQILLFGALGLFILLNIFYSQAVSPLYFRLVDEDKSAVISFLTRIRNWPQFSSQLTIFKNLYGAGIEDEVFAQERAEKQLINNFEQILQKNPQSRDILYSLFLLTHEQKYLQQAKAIDPLIK